MKKFVITILDNKDSMIAADNCIKSAASLNINVEKFAAITPKDKPLEMLKVYKIPEEGFHEKYSRLENVTAAFLSHYLLWRYCVELNEEFCVLEHDAYFMDIIPNVQYKGLLSLGQPSYGKYNDPLKIGVNPLTSKRYLPGAHAYLLKPSAAKLLIAEAIFSAKPTDVYIHIDRFPWLEEYYPWPVVARDTFTTIQREAGCKAKHNFKSGYRIL